MKPFIRFAAVLLLALCLAPAAQAAVNSDAPAAAHPEDALFPGEDSGAPAPAPEGGSWSAAAQNDAAAAAAETGSQFADDPDAPMPTGSWSAAEGVKTSGDSADPMPSGSWSAADSAEKKAAAPDKSAGGKLPEEGHIVVTSMQTCYDQLDPKDAADIQAHYVKPYAECQSRLQDRLEGRKTAKARRAAAEEPVAETPRNYIRVQQDKIPNSRANSDDTTNP